MKRYSTACGQYGETIMIEHAHGEWVKFADVPKMDKPAALLALVEYGYADERTELAIHKLAAAIIAEAEEL